MTPQDRNDGRNPWGRGDNYNTPVINSSGDDWHCKKTLP